ncbi:hypothetical protein QNK12_14235 [Neobacillus cucumis]|nr:hypothetical protein QNK12_14235 [Neobacillus cucumis]
MPNKDATFSIRKIQNSPFDLQPALGVRHEFLINPETREKQFGTIEEETLQALKNVEMIVEAAGSKKEQIFRLAFS